MTAAQRAIVREIRRLHSRREPLNIPAAKRNHPELIKRVYAVRPFWGWKRALEDAGLGYDKIESDLLDYVECKICGEDRGQLNVHLLRKHGVTADDYRSEYPDAETTCERLRAVIAEHRLRKRLPVRRWETVWTPEYALDRMDELHRQRFPMNLDWVTEHDQALSVKAREYFGSWDEALRRIGLDPEKIRLAKPTEHLTKRELVARLKRKSGVGRNCKVGSKDDSPLANAARKYFGSWNAALRAAGIEPAKETTQWARADKPALLREVRRRLRAGEALRSAQVLKEKHGRALLDSATRLFGSWNAALRGAGIEPVKEDSPWRTANKSAIIAEIRRRVRAGESLATRKIERTKWGHPLINRAKALFDTWAGALLAANVDLPPGLMSPWPNASKVAILTGIRRRRRGGKTLRISRIEREPWGSSFARRARILFSSWDAAIRAADRC